MENPGGIIRKLDETVVNRIAAGEVIQRPANALKELLENSLDAQSTSIQVVVNQGGLKLLQITDNGTGIKREDMQIVCERFTTSKLRSFSDLCEVTTYGFRGEALASVSHVAHVTIATRTADSVCAYRGMYGDGRLKGAVKACAGNIGTQITVEDLFYNVTTRRNALKSSAAEHAKVVEVVSRYAVHNAKVGFTLKKHGERTADVHTPRSSTSLENIRTIYGSAVARELLEVKMEDAKLCVAMTGLVSNANYSMKKCTFLLFINHRLVESASLTKALKTVYAAYLPKNTYPFLYVSLQIEPRNVDVNVHPTKHEVHFLHEEAITGALQRAVEETLLASGSSRTYFTQALLPGAQVITTDLDMDESESKKGAPQKASAETPKVYAHQMVRTDCKDRKMDAFLQRAPPVAAAVGVATDPPDGARDQPPNPGKRQRSIDGADDAVATTTDATPSPAVTTTSTTTSTTSTTTEAPRRREIRLDSVLALRRDIERNCHEGVSDIFQKHTFVGCVTPQYALIQHSTQLYLVNTTRTSKELFYQIIMYNFGNFGVLRLSEPAAIFDLTMIALESEESGWTEAEGSKVDLAQYVVDFLKAKSELLSDYFSMDIDENGLLCTLPMLLDGYIPPLEAALPMYILRLATELNWDDEKSCFETFARETAEFYSLKKEWFEPIRGEGGSIAAEDQDVKSCETSSSRGEDWRWAVEHVVFPACRSRLRPPRAFATDATVLKIASLPDLYRVFERC